MCLKLDKILFSRRIDVFSLPPSAKLVQICVCMFAGEGLGLVWNSVCLGVCIGILGSDGLC